MRLSGIEKLAAYPFLIATLIGIFLLILSASLNINILVNFAFSIISMGIASLLFFVVIYTPIKLNKHPYIENSEDVQNLKATLDTTQIKNTIKSLYHERGRNAIDIAWMLEKYLNLELHIKKGIRAGWIKSEVLYKKIDEILGINSKILRRIAIPNDSDYYSPIIYKIGIGILILGLIAISITLLFIPL